MAYLARRSTDYGIETGPVTVNMAAVRRRKQAMVDMSALQEGIFAHPTWAESLNNLFMGMK